MMKKPPQRQTACTRCNGWAARAQPGSKTDAARVAARYVRVDAELNGWLFFDELEVLGQTQAGDAVTLSQDADFEGAFLLSGPQTGGIRDMVLMYNGPYKDYGGNPGYGNWSKAGLQALCSLCG